MPRYDFSHRALTDLLEIARYTRKNWGLKQARLYRQELELGIQKLALSPELGPLRGDIAPLVRAFPVARHVAYYVPDEDGITVLRILHPRMNADRAITPQGER